MQNLLFLGALIICVIARVKEIRKGKKEERLENSFWEKRGNLMFVLILLLFLGSVLYRIEEVPNGLHVDEAGAFYDAICIANYGVDRYLYRLPVYFTNFGGGQNALYTYLVAIMIKLFGSSKLIFRLPSVILSAIALICFYQMIKGNSSKKEALCATFILAIAPWFVMKTRWGLESYLMCSLMTISTFVLMKALKTGKTWLYILSGICWGLTLYTYAIAYLIVPLLLFVVLLYGLLTKQIKIKSVIFMAIPLAILALPLILMLAYNSGILEQVQLPIVSIPKLWFYRGSEISLKNIPGNIQSIFEILFIKDFLNYNAIPEFGTLYRMSIPLVIFGLIEVIKNVVKNVKEKKLSLDFVMLVSFVGMFLIGLCIAELNINKINAIYIPMIYFAGKFLAYIAKYIKSGEVVILVMYLFSYAMFLNYYFTEFANTDLYLFENDIIDASQKAEELDKETIYVENCLNQTYIYTLIATPISPYEFNENLQIQNGIVVAYGKYQFEIPEEIDKNAVYILKNDTSKMEALETAGFEKEKQGEFYLFYDRLTEEIER